MVRHRHSAHERERLARARPVLLHSRDRSNARKALRPCRLLENDQVRAALADDPRDPVLAAGAAQLDVVAEDLQGQVPDRWSISTWYGCPSRSPRKWMTISRDA